MGSPEAASPVSEDGSWAGLSPEASTSSFESSSPVKLFIFNLARTVTDQDLRPLFAPFQPLYATVAVGKKGTSRRFGFAKFASPTAAHAALEALSGTLLHGKELELKFAVTLEDPDPVCGVQAKLRARLQSEAQDSSPRIAAHHPTTAAAAPCMPAGHARPARVVPLPAPLSMVPPSLWAGPSMTGTAAGAEAPTHATLYLPAPTAAPVVELRDFSPPMQHLLVVHHDTGTSHDSVMQKVWCFRPINVSTNLDAMGQTKSTVLFATLQQAKAAADVFSQPGPDGRPAATASLVSLPLHIPPEHFYPPAPAPAPQLPEVPPQLAWAAPQQPLPACMLQQVPPATERLPVPAGMRAPPLPQPQQQQREGVGATMRPLYAAPRPSHMPVMHSIFSNIEAALAGQSFVPAWDRLQQEAPRLGQPLVLAETLQYDSSTEDEGDFEPDPREVYAAVSPGNLTAVFVTRALVRRLAPVELLLKQTEIGGHEAAPSVLVGAVVRVLIDKAYKLRQVQSTYIKPESQRLMLVLHDVSSPIPADHISNTNPLLGGDAGQLPAPAEAELLELHSKMAFHSRRLFRHEVAVTAWRLQFADHWQGREAGGRSGDELRLAVAHLRAMLEDEDEIRWRRRGVQGLDLGQEAAAMAAAFHLPHRAAANWMSSPQALAVSTYPGGSPSSAERSNVTGDYQSRPPLSQHEVLGLQRSSRLLPSRAAARSLVRAASEPTRHDALMASFYAGQHPPPEEPIGMASEDSMAPAAPPAAAAGVQAFCFSGHGRDSGASLDGHSAGDGSASTSEHGGEQSDNDRLLAEAATFGSDDVDTEGLPEFFSASLKLEVAGGTATPASKQTASNENGHGHGNLSMEPQPDHPPAAKGKSILLAALERRGSMPQLIAAVRSTPACAALGTAEG